MKVLIKKLNGTHFEIEVNLEDTVADVKKHIENIKGSDVYPAARQMLIHKGKVLKDGTTLQENEVFENSSMVIMLSKNTSSSAPPPTRVAAPELPPVTRAPPAPTVNPTQATQPPPVPPAHPIGPNANPLILNLLPQATRPLPPPPAPPIGPNTNPLNLFPQATRPLLPPPAPPIGLNANPLNFFPQRVPAGARGILGFLRNNLQFQAFRSVMRAHPHVLEIFLQHWESRRPQLSGLRSEFTRMIFDPEPLRWEIENLSLTVQDLNAIYRLIAMGFDASVVWEVYYHFNKNEEQAASFLQNHRHEF